VLYQAAVEAGAPEDIIQCVDTATLEGTNALMRHERTSVILSTGGAAIVKAAYSSGKPAFGVGPGNVPVLVDTSADLDDAIPKIVAGKSFDYGTVCSSEQAIVAEASLRDRILSLLKAQKAYIATDAQKDALGKLLITSNWTVNPNCVGQAPTKIAAWPASKCPRTPPSSAPKWAAWASSIRSPPRSSRRCSRSTSCRISIAASRPASRC
jgi:acetaldehyde dehydrogenase (acetylating)